MVVLSPTVRLKNYECILTNCHAIAMLHHVLPCYSLRSMVQALIDHVAFTFV